MQIETQKTTNADGSMDLHVLTQFPNAEVKVVIWIEPKSNPEELGWPEGYFDELYGSTADIGLEEPPELILESRESFL